MLENLSKVFFATIYIIHLFGILQEYFLASSLNTTKSFFYIHYEGSKKHKLDIEPSMFRLKMKCLKYLFRFPHEKFIKVFCF